MRVIGVVSVIISVINAASIKDEWEPGNLEPVLNYHDNVGIPHARRIKEAEDALADNSSIRIVGGDLTDINEHPYLAGMIIKLLYSSDESVCGGALLSPRRLVTAAHCWDDGRRRGWLVQVVLGSQYLYHGGVRIPTTTVVTHPEFKPKTYENDIAMVKLCVDVTFSEQIQPIALPSESQLSQSFAGHWATASGYGRIHDDVRVSDSSQVSQVTLNVIPLVSCRAMFSSRYVQDSTLCTSGSGGVGICFGDSGGPLAVREGGRDLLIGVSSFVAKAGCSEGFPSAFARVTSFHGFITSHLK